MANNQVDVLQIKIENAKAKLPVETTNAIAAVDWHAAIMTIRQKKGYTFEQLGELETETELMLCGLTNSADYATELQTRMKISKAETDELVNEMNILVFSKIKEELIKNTERKKIFQAHSTIEPEQSPVRSRPLEHESATVTLGRPASNGMNNTDTTVLKSAGIELDLEKTPELQAPMENREDLLKKVENPEKVEALKPTSILQEKMFGSSQAPVTKTEHVMENIPKENTSKAPEVAPVPSSASAPASYADKKDPYRLSPDE